MEMINVNIVDIIILIILAFGALLGFKRGFTKQLVSLVGIFAIIILSFLSLQIKHNCRWGDSLTRSH